MNALTYLALAAALATAADLPKVSSLRPETRKASDAPSSANLPLLALPDWQPQPPQQPAKKSDRLQPYSRLSLVRYISGEFAKVVTPLPAVKPGFRVKPGEEVNQELLRNALLRGGSAGNPGDSVQITKLTFKDREILVDINGGSKKGGKSWRERIEVGVSGGPMPRGRVEQVGGQQMSGPGGYRDRGATLILDFGRPLPDMTPDEFKEHLAKFLDFSKQRSAAVNWVESLPAEYQKAIKEKRAVEGMDREMVVAAMGRPDNKVRERDADGNETEDWIYGHPPGKTIFVKFIGDKVVAVREFPG
jgi:hypothetical protein